MLFSFLTLRTGQDIPAASCLWNPSFLPPCLALGLWHPETQPSLEHLSHPKVPPSGLACQSRFPHPQETAFLRSHISQRVCIRIQAWRGPQGTFIRRKVTSFPCPTPCPASPQTLVSASAVVKAAGLGQDAGYPWHKALRGAIILLTAVCIPHVCSQVLCFAL